MALKALMLRKRIDDKKKALSALQENDLQQREADLVEAINEATTEEEKKTVEEAVEAFDNDKAENEKAQRELAEQIEALEADLAAEEAAQENKGDEKPEPEPEAKPEETRGDKKMINIETRTAMVKDESVQNWLGEIRTAIREKRAIQNAGLLVPEVVLPVLRENIARWSKLYEHATVRQIAGEGRQPVMGVIPEAIWTECCANLNELTLAFNDWAVDCYKVAGYVAICNANLEDSDADLVGIVLEAIGSAIGKALDKAILYGRNTTAAANMPLGVVTRLLQTAQPSGYPATARAWEDLHETHVVDAEGSGAELIRGLVEASGVAASDYSRGELTWVMNDKTYKKVVAAALGINAAGAIVSGIDGRMPVVGGDIEVLNFIPDDVVIFGYFDLYLLAERAGRAFAQSEHVRFLQDQTVIKGVARYDGAPIIAEAFGIAIVGDATASATAVTFASDTANA